jgi:hypothetical protein
MSEDNHNRSLRGFPTTNTVGYSKTMPNSVSEIDRPMDSFQKEFRRVHNEISKIIVGYSDTIDDILMAILGKGHVLLEGRAGPGKDETRSDLERRVASALCTNPIHTGLDAGGHRRDECRSRKRSRR